MKYFSIDTGVINHWKNDRLMLYLTQAFFVVFRMSINGLKEWHWYCLLSQFTRPGFSKSSKRAGRWCSKRFTHFKLSHLALQCFRILKGSVYVKSRNSLFELWWKYKNTSMRRYSLGTLVGSEPSLQRLHKDLPGGKHNQSRTRRESSP